MCCLDGLSEQLPPVRSWGYKFTLTPFLSLNCGYLYRVFTTIYSATLYMSDGSITHIAAESFYEEDVTGDTVVSFTSDQPMMVVQYMKGGYANTPYRGDPSMLIVTPNRAFTAVVTFLVIEYTYPHTYYMNVIIECDYLDGILLDETPFMSWDLLHTSDTLICCLRSNVSVGHHNVSHTHPMARFSVIVYAVGEGRTSSYAYAANPFGSAGMESLPTQPETKPTKDITAVTAPIVPTNNAIVQDVDGRSLPRQSSMAVAKFVFLLLRVYDSSTSAYSIVMPFLIVKHLKRVLILYRI
ncbi:uncharacterized protein [Amphiura filiformis]|uniref:uncharacterized protein n=1 Tax=Amphiura filiformis TaxID=82378 RepID=UPI003B225170